MFCEAWRRQRSMTSAEWAVGDEMMFQLAAGG
jgi:hypothetical protein